MWRLPHRLCHGHTLPFPFGRLLTAENFYCKKENITGTPSQNASISGSLVLSSKPFSIIAGLFAGYTPLGVESCNELLDECFPKIYWSGVCLRVPLWQDKISNQYAALTSDSQDFWVIPSKRRRHHTFHKRKSGVQFSAPGNLMIR